MKGATHFSKIWISSIVLLTIASDQLVKVLTRLEIVPQSYNSVIKDYFIVTNIENTGAMLGFGQDFPPLVKRIFFQAIPLLVLGILLYRILTKSSLKPLSLTAFALVIGGGLGNLIDRIVYGSVTDSFQLRFAFLRTGIFNLADVAVTIGIVLLLYEMIKSKTLSL
ncbi:signal peptidase II [Maribacter sp. MAR_2009_72]|uniref:signal peptidase II n=1 Tax=Maribacter sp. MAR_2009_72 TaxID=1250050 RepID=UPI00119A035F|nr:signal peptidase II [Maribacter sp. MAR_2009_72]TVZ14408.1 signal peptidase II [Maribacter sp. MAR_2009_72]